MNCAFWRVEMSSGIVEIGCDVAFELVFRDELMVVFVSVCRSDELCRLQNGALPDGRG